MTKLIDLSQYIENNMPVYPGDQATTLVQAAKLDTDGFNNYRLHTGMHSGTHIDSPMHLCRSDRFISELPLEVFAAKGCILDVRGQANVTMKQEYCKIVKEGSIVLLFTGHDRFYGSGEYYHNSPVVDLELAKFFVAKKISMLGMDMPSPDKLPFEVHKILLSNNIFILENLTQLEKLINVPDFEIIALPLKINSDSSLTRAVARVLNTARG